MVSLTLKRIFFKGHIAFELPVEMEYREAIKKELTKCRDKFQDYVQVTLQAPKRERTTGPHSQNHHLNGHIMQICNVTGNSYDAVKYTIKMLAVENMDYPYSEIAGHIVPQGERECSTEDCAKLIEASHFLAAELGIILKEV